MSFPSHPVEMPAASPHAINAFPSGACDTHFHVFGPEAEFPLIAERSYTPPAASLSQYQHAIGSLGVERSVLVQPSVYGRDHSLLKQVLAEAESGSMRGVAVIFDDTPDHEIEELHRLGVRGARCNALFDGGTSVDSMQSIADRVRPFGWHIQLLVDIDADLALVRALVDQGTTVVLDHFGHPRDCRNLHSAGIRSLQSMLKEGQAWVKFSAPYRLSASGSANDPCVLPLAHRLAETAPHRIVWGSDWPHPGISAIDNTAARLASLASQWFPGDLMQQALVENPTRLYWTV